MFYAKKYCPRSNYQPSCELDAMINANNPGADWKDSYYCIYCTDRFKTCQRATKLSDCNGIRTLNHLVRKWTLNHLAKLAMVVCSFTSGCGFESRCSHLSQILTYIRSNIQMSWFHQMPKHTKYILLNNMVSKHSLVMNFGQFI